MTTSNIGQFKRYAIINYYINKYKPKKILEIGSGSQGIGRCYDIKFDGLDLTTSDYSGNEKTTNKNMNFICGSALDMPIADYSYDFVYSTDMIEHISKKDRKKAFEEAYRVCKKGGYVLFMFPCGFFGKLSDIFVFITLKFLNIFHKDNMNHIPLWLKEHLENNYPISKEVDEYYEDYEVIENKKIHNIFVWTFCTLLDMTRVNKDRITNKILNSNPYFGNSLFGYRKLILIKK